MFSKPVSILPEVTLPLGTIVLILYLIAVNLFAFFLYGADKRRAKKGRRRIRERTLLLAAVFGGSVGALLGMRVFHHKTLHRKFTVGVPAILILQLILAAAYFVLTNDALRRLLI